MPIPLSPNDTFDLSLRDDMPVDERGRLLDAGMLRRPPADAPAFCFRCYSGRQERDYAVKVDELEAGTITETDADGRQAARMMTNVELHDTTFRLLGERLAGWKNLVNKNGEAVAYDPAAAEDVLIAAEARELIQRVMAWSPDVGFCASPSNSPEARSAAKTPAGDAK